MALLADELTTATLTAECVVRPITFRNHLSVLRDWRPDVLFVESAWNGHRNAWKYQIASYSGHPERSNNNLRQVLRVAEDLGVPALFWNKEDGVHYDRFIDTARLFKHIFTVDSNCVERYQRDVPGCTNVQSLMFAVQPAFHNVHKPRNASHGFACFVGSYGTHVHPGRKYWQDLMFQAVAPSGLNIFDRNYKRKSDVYRFPSFAGMEVRPGVPYENTADIYRQHKICLNVNTVEDSPTMYSRRLVEILGVGGIAISSPSIAAQKIFSEYCYLINSQEELGAALEDIQGQGYVRALERALLGAHMVASTHTWEHRLSEIENLGIF